jgi:hypothetical protein
MIRTIVVCAAFVVAASSIVGRSQSPEGQVNYGSRRFDPLYEEERQPPPTDENGWPADWDQRPHLSLDVFGVTREFNTTRDYSNGPLSYADRPYGRHGYGNGPHASHGYGRGPYGPRGDPVGRGNHDYFSSDSGFALRYGYPGQDSAYGAYPPSFGYPGPAYGLYPTPFGYGPYDGPPPYYGYGPPHWGGGSIIEPPGSYRRYFGW